MIRYDNNITPEEYMELCREVCWPDQLPCIMFLN